MMDGACFKSSSNFLPNKCGRRRDDRISELPDEIIIAILSFLPLKKAVATSVLSLRWLNLWKHIPNLKFDRISQLPDRIVVAILSFLPLRAAAATSILSSRWSDLWKHTPNLDFNTRNAVQESSCTCSKYVKMVNSVLRSHKAPSLKLFRISLYVNESAKRAVHKWLEFVFSRQVERLELDFQCEEEHMVVVLEEVLREKNNSLCRRPQTDLILSKSLKRLCLKYINVSGEDIELFLRSCPLLEELIIGYAVLRSDVEVCGANLILKHLEIYCCSGNKSIKVCAPNLTWIGVDNTSRKLLLENVPKLVWADFRFRSGSPQSFSSQVCFCISSQLKNLNLNLLSPEVFLANGIPKMPNLKKLVVGYYESIAHSFLSVTALIWASPRLEEFKLEFGYMLKNGTALNEVKSNVKRSPSSPHQHLKVFELARFPRGHEDHVDELVRYIINNCTALEKIIFGRSSWFQYSRGLCNSEAAGAYVKQQLQGKLPQHIQLQLL